ncbi:PLP-dependent aminotransferase family protein [Clostridium sp. OM05-9]|jgi:GntR family transcriptional regulator/MocR family aminotransferase|uniref:MocR-like pyridoxine biosynthesis transcription factor PdxR n=1 Tax=unclassified Clostridium TaxID=2614128 RepID=UPI000E4E6BB6|nr:MULTISPECIES: PLP-dependent aminotransferase family protein [unclassified Clostridium]RGH07886.1 PLP-dependent aminotransferase family protein [Clostridium sp. AF15-31]RHP91679.1 PLP-dependent aminotransferase family protein [Clostridium sp. AM54-37XD]RHV14178.1 PLP-dependent aminotransferase family protein [Clostridium sp. OM05-9]
MLTYALENRGTDTLYEYLYKQIKTDILSKKLVAGERLPSKRLLAKNLNVSTITVENAYSQLVAEGYIYSIPKSGYYVTDISADLMKPLPERPAKQFEKPKEKKTYFADFASNSTVEDAFPFSIWSKLLKEVMAENSKELMSRSPSKGVYELRSAVAGYLYQFRGMDVKPEQVIIGAGTEYLYGLIIQLLGYDKCYAVEDPGYQKISRIYQAQNVCCKFVAMDGNGINMEALEESGADVLHISPAHHFPTGLVTPVSRRYELLSWASRKDNRYIIEDEYDSEFRLVGKPVPTLESIDVGEKVIYINTFSKSLSSTIRISYMVLPESLMRRYDEMLSFYACTVSNIEQYTLARFITDGCLEKHINRMRNYYREQRDLVLACIKKYMNPDKIRIREENSGLHFLLEIDTNYSDDRLRNNAEARDVHISFLSQYYRNTENARYHTLVINYSGIMPEHIEEAVRRLIESIE